ncbi:Os11g0209450, partial [Oryza sativa Japonica Group]
MPEPEIHEAGVAAAAVGRQPGEAELAGVQRRAPAEEQQMVHEIAELLHGHQPHPVVVGDAQARGGLPEVAPPPRQHARPHGVRRRQEPDDVMQYFVRQVPYPIVARARGSLAPPPRLPWRRHSVEQVAGVAAAGQETT